MVRFTLEGPSASSIETSTSEKPVSSADGVSAEGSVSARFLLRAHNLSRFPKRVTFESAQRGARVDSNVSKGSSFTERDDEEKKYDGSHAGVPASGWIHTPRNDAVETKTRGRAEEKLTSLPPGPPWLWTGPTRRSATVSPGATATVELVATAFTPGVFVLNEYGREEWRWQGEPRRRSRSRDEPRRDELRRRDERWQDEQCPHHDGRHDERRGKWRRVRRDAGGRVGRAVSVDRR